MLQYRSFLPSQDKVKVVDFHPVQPWIALASVQDAVAVWDHNSRQVLHEMQMGGQDEDTAQEMLLNRLAERDSRFTGNPSATAGATAAAAAAGASKIASGHVRTVKFLDAEVAYWQSAVQHYIVNGSSTLPPPAGTVTALEGRRLLTLVCENKVVLYDLASRHASEIPRTTLDNSKPTSLSFLFRGPAGARNAVAGGLMSSPLLAIGCSDGCIRLVQLSSMRMVARLSVGNTKHAITALMTMPTKLGGGGGHDMLVAGDANGTVYLFDPLAKSLGGGGIERDVAPFKIAQGHEKGQEVMGIQLISGAEEVEGAAPRVVTAGADHRVVTWAIPQLKEIERNKLDTKTPNLGLGYSHRYFNLSGAHSMLVATGGPEVFVMHTITGTLRNVCNVGGIIPPAANKKPPKTYVIAVNPLRPHLVAVGCNSGLAFLAFERLFPLPAVALPLLSPSRAHVSPSRPGPDDTQQCSFVVQLGDKIWLYHCAPPGADALAADPTLAAMPPTPRVVAKELVGSCTGQVNRAEAGCSPHGDYVSFLWPGTRQYIIYYRTLAGTWTECDRGHGVSLAWHTHKDMYAVLDEPQTAVPQQALKVRSKSKLQLGKRKEEDPAIVKARLEAAAAMAAAATVVRIRSLEGINATTVVNEMSLAGDTPIALHSGPMLGVAYRRTMTSTSGVAGEETACAMQFYSWDSRAKVGSELPEPSWMSWDPSLQLAAMAYGHQVLVFRVRPTFEVIAAIAISNATGAAWATRQLYLINHSSVLLAFINPTAPPLNPGTPASPAAVAAAPAAVKIVTLATVQGAAAAATARSRASRAASALPSPEVRPPGHMTLLGPRDGNLWLLNAHGQPVILPMSHPGLRALCLAAMGDLRGAAHVAEHGLAYKHHDSLAAFLLNMAGNYGAQVALPGLPGLSVYMEAELSMATGHWKRALACCQAVMAGCQDREHLSASTEFRRRTKKASYVHRSSTAGVPTSNRPSLRGTGPLGLQRLVDTFVSYSDDEDAAAAAAANGAAVAPDAPSQLDKLQVLGDDGGIDWEAPLSSDFKVTMTPAATDGAAVPGDGGTGSTGGAAAVANGGDEEDAEHSEPAPTGSTNGAAQPSAAAVELAMRLVDSSSLAGKVDITRSGLQLLLKYRAALQPLQLAKLASKMAEVDMQPSLKELAAEMVVQGSHQAQVTGIVSAALSGDLEQLQSALQKTGLRALAALEANSYRLKSSQTREHSWNGALKDASARMAAAPTSSYAHFVVLPS